MTLSPVIYGWIAVVTVVSGLSATYFLLPATTQERIKEFIESIQNN